MTIYDELKTIIDPVYQVGGSIRDEFLGKEPTDYDFATPLSPDEVEKRIKESVNKYGDNRKCYNIGKKFGTLGLKIHGQLVEITTFRTEKYHKGSRKPTVEFVKNITADLSRRDFTINAIAKRGNKYIDPFGGREDIKIKLIKCVGKPNERFKEDPLRMLRVARFASQLSFHIDDNTENYAKQLAYKILEVSKERWVAELDKLLMGENPESGLNFLVRTRLLNFLIPELILQCDYDQNSPYHVFDLWTHTIKTINYCPQDIILRWAALLHDIAKPFVRTNKVDKSNYIYHDYLGAEMVERLGLYLRWSNERRIQVKEIVLNHFKVDSPLKEADDKAKGK